MTSGNDPFWAVLSFCPPGCEIPIRSMEGSPLVPMMYSPQFRERAVALIVDEGHRVADVARDLGVTEGTLYRWKQQALIDRGEISGTSTVESRQLRDALNRVKQLEEELRATRLAATILDDITISPKGVSRLSRP